MKYNRHYESFLPGNELLMEENYEDLCDIVDAVECGQTAQAARLSQNQVRRSNRRMKEKQ